MHALSRYSVVHAKYAALDMHRDDQDPKARQRMARLDKLSQNPSFPPFFGSWNFVTGARQDQNTSKRCDDWLDSPPHGMADVGLSVSINLVPRRHKTGFEAKILASVVLFGGTLAILPPCVVSG